MNVETGFELGDIGGILRRRAKLMAGTALVVSLAAYWIAMALPNEYESFATILVSPQIVSKDLVEAGVGQTNLTERLGIMTAEILSRPRLSRIIDELGLYAAESRTMLRQDVIDLMRGDIRVEPVVPELEQRAGARRRDAEINTFRILFSHESPATAAEVAQRVAQNFIDQHIRARIELTQKSLDFMNGELEELGQRIGEVENRVAEVKDANPGRLPEDMNANHHRMERLAAEVAYAQRALAEARSDEAFYRSREEASGSMGVGDDDGTSPTRRIRLLELVLAELTAKGYTRKHPDVSKAEDELAVLRAQIKSRQARRAQGVESPEPGQEDLLGMAFASETLRAVRRRELAEQELARLQASTAEIEAKVAETPRVAEQLDALQREYRHLFESYQDFSNRRLEATLKAQLERRQLGEQFRVIESAFQAAEPSSPNRPLIVLLGLFFAVATALAVGVLVEALDPSVHTARQLQATVSAPVLGAIPKIWLESDRAAQRRSRWFTAALATGFVGFCLVGGLANYVWVNGGLGRGGPGAEPAAEPAPTPEVAEQAPAEGAGG